MTQVRNAHVADALPSPLEACLANLAIGCIVDCHFRLECEVAARLAIFSCQIVDFPASVYLGNFESIQICENGAAKRVFAFINEELLILLALSAFENFILLVDDSQIYFREKRGWYLIRA